MTLENNQLEATVLFLYIRIYRIYDQKVDESSTCMVGQFLLFFFATNLLGYSCVKTDLDSNYWTTRHLVSCDI